MAGVFAARGSSVLVVHGDDGLDELTTTTTSTIWRVQAGTVERLTFDPPASGSPGPSLERAGRRRRRDQRRGGARACSAVPRGRCATPWCSTPRARWSPTPGYPATPNGCRRGRPGLRRAAEAIDSGAAEQLLARWVRFTSAALSRADGLLGGQPRRTRRGRPRRPAAGGPQRRCPARVAAPRRCARPARRASARSARSPRPARRPAAPVPGRIACAPAQIASTTGIGGTPRRARCPRRRAGRGGPPRAASRRRRRARRRPARSTAASARSRWPRHSTSTAAAVWSRSRAALS